MQNKLKNSKNFENTEYGAPLINIMDTHVIASSMQDSVNLSRRDGQ
jgi:hypothetical protein